MGRAVFTAFLSLVLLNACSSGSGANPGSTQSGGSTCNAVCQKGVNLHCSQLDTTLSECTNECEAEFSGEACASESLGLSLCALDALGCDFIDGDPDTGALLQACGGQSTAYVACQACAMSADDSDCQACQKTSCCAERKAVYQNPDTTKYTACYSACTDDPCKQACVDQYPSLVTLTEAELACYNDKCAAACSVD